MLLVMEGMDGSLYTFVSLNLSRNLRNCPAKLKTAQKQGEDFIFMFEAIVKSRISSKTSRGKKDSTKRHQHRHDQRQLGEQQFPTQVVTG